MRLIDLVERKDAVDNGFELAVIEAAATGRGANLRART
jgi:hypothetical protein